MISKLDLAKIIADQQQLFHKKKWIDRTVDIPIDSSRIIIVTGVRRCGKSTLIKKALLGTNKALYVNFEDPRLINFTVQDFIRLEELLHEQDKSLLIFDEVQNITQWELYARLAHEKGLKLFVTGSNASMLSRELGTRLTGRHYQVELFPFNFDEFLDFFELARNKESFEKYFQLGGFPEYLQETNDDYLRSLLKDIITRDIAVRKNITNETQLTRLAVYLMSNIGKELSYNKLSKTLEIKSVRTVIDYCDYFRESYLMEFIPMFSYSIKKQLGNPKKVYSIDPSFARANSLSFSADLGRRLENFVFNKIRREHQEIFYYRSANTECDFLVKHNEKIVKAIQVCWQIDTDNMEREINGLKNAQQETGADAGLIVTADQEDTLDGIPLIPAWKWL